MQTKNDNFSFPVLLERLPVRTPRDECVKALDADIGMGTLAIHLDRDRFTLNHEEVLARTPADEIAPRLMSGGRVAYLAEEHGHPTLYLRKPAGHAEPIAPELEVTSHIVSPDGKRLVFTDRRGWVRHWTEKDGVNRPFCKAPGRTKLLGFDAEGQSLLFSKKTRSSFQVFSHNFQKNEITLLFQDHDRRDGPQFSAIITPSGEHLIVTRDHFITKVDISAGTMEQSVIPHSPSFHNRAPRLLTALDDRFLLFGKENWYKLNDMDSEALFSDDLDLSEVDCNEDGAYYDRDNWPEAVPVMDFTVYDLANEEAIHGEWSPRIGNAFLAGGEATQSAFERSFPQTTHQQELYWKKVEEAQTRPQRELERLTNIGW